MECPKIADVSSMCGCMENEIQSRKTGFYVHLCLTPGSVRFQEQAPTHTCKTPEKQATF